MKLNSVGCLVGRFQVHILHDAHKHIIEQVRSKHDKVILFLGTTKDTGSPENPMDFVTREKMIQHEYPDIKILPLPNFLDDHQWSLELDRGIRSIYSKEEVILYGGRDSFIPCYSGSFKTMELEQHTYVSGTEVRKKVSTEIANSSDFRAGIIYNAYNQPKRTFLKCHSIILDETRTKTLMVKNPNENKWSFLGGFVEPDDFDVHSAICRVINSNTNCKVIESCFLDILKINEWDFKNKAYTTLYECIVSSENIQPSQEISELRWFDIRSELNYLNTELTTGHHEILNYLKVIK